MRQLRTSDPDSASSTKLGRFRRASAMSTASTSRNCPLLCTSRQPCHEAAAGAASEIAPVACYARSLSRLQLNTGTSSSTASMGSMTTIDSMRPSPRATPLLVQDTVGIFYDAWNCGNIEAIAGLLGDEGDYIDPLCQSPIRGEPLIAHIRRFLAAFSRARVDVTQDIPHRYDSRRRVATYRCLRWRDRSGTEGSRASRFASPGWIRLGSKARR